MAYNYSNNGLPPEFPSAPQRPAPPVPPQLPTIPKMYAPHRPGETYRSAVPTYTTQTVPVEQPVQESDSLISDFDNPNQINSFLDVVSKAFDPSENGDQIFSLTTFIDASKELFSRTVLKPTTPEFFINNLVNFGESVDVLANVVKAALPTSITTARNYSELENSTPGQRVQAALGINIPGRYAFDIDFGLSNTFLNMATSFVGEMLVDPLNWFTLGLGGIAKQGAKTALTKTAERLAVSAGKNASEAILTPINLRNLSRRTAEAFLKNDQEAFTDIFVTFLKQQKFNDIVYKELQKNSQVLNELGHKMFIQAQGAATHKMNIQTLRALNQISRSADTIDHWVIRVSGMPVFTPVYYMAKFGGGTLARYANNAISRALKAYTVNHLNKDMGCNLADVQSIIDAVHNEAGKLNMTGEFPKEYYDDIAKFNQEVVENSASAQILTLSDIAYSSSDDIAILDKLRNAVSVFTNKKCTTLAEYFEVCKSAFNTTAIPQVHAADLLARLENLVKLEKALEANKDLVGYYYLLRQVKDNYLNYPALKQSIDHLLDTFKVLKEQDFEYDKLNGIYVDQAFTENVVEPLYRLHDMEYEDLDNLLGNPTFSILENNDNLYQQYSDTLYTAYTRVEDAISDIVNKFEEHETIKHIEFYSLVKAYKDAYSSLGTLLDSIINAIDSMMRGSAAKEVMDFSKPLEGRANQMSDIVTRYFKSPVLTKPLGDHPSDTKLSQISFDLDLENVKKTIGDSIDTLRSNENYKIERHFIKESDIDFSDLDDAFKDLNELEESATLNEFVKAVNSVREAYDNIVNSLIDIREERRTPDMTLRFGDQNDVEMRQIGERTIRLEDSDKEFTVPILETVGPSENKIISAEIQDIRDIQHYMDRCVNMTRYLFEDNKAWVQVHTERFMNTIEMLTGPLPIKLYEMFNDNTTIGSAIKGIRAALENSPSDDLNVLLKSSLDELESQVNYMRFQRGFISQVGYAFKDDDRKWYAFLETFQKYGQQDLALLLDNNTVESFAHAMQVNSSSRYMLKRINLDSYRERLYNTEEFEFLEKNFDSSLFDRMRKFGHDDPGSDVLMTKYAFLYDCPEQAEALDTYLRKNPNANATVFDIETAERNDALKGAKNRFTGMITQISAMDYRTNEPIVFRLNKLRDIYAEGTENLPNVRYIYGDSDLDLLNAFESYLRTSNTTRLVGANSAGFDVPFMRYRWSSETSQYYSSRFFEILKNKDHIDIQQELLKKQDIPVITENDRAIIKSLLSGYAKGLMSMGYINVQNIKPHNITRILRDINTNLMDRASRVKGVKDINRTIDGFSIVTINPDDVLWPLRNYMEDLSKLQEDYESVLNNRNFTDVLGRDLFKENATSDSLEELSRFTGWSEDAIKKALQGELNLTEDDIKIFFSNNPSVRGYDVIQNRVSTWWRNQMLYQELANPGESYDDFIKRIYRGRSEISNLQQLFYGPGEHGMLNYTNVVSKTKVPDFVKPIGQGDAIHVKTNRRLQHKIKQIQKLIDHTIKNEENIFKIGLFENIQELADATKALVAPRAQDPYDWLHYIDLDKFTTPKEWFALWYTIQNENIYIRVANDLEVVKTGTMTKELGDAIREKIWDRIYISIFDNKELDKIHRRASSASPVYDLINDSLFSTYTGSRRVMELCAQLNHIPGSGAKEYAVRQLSNALGILMRKLDQLPIHSREHYIREYNKLNERRILANSLDYLSHAIDDDTGIDYIISDLIFNTPIGVKEIIFPDDKAISHMFNKDNQLYMRMANKLASKQDELTEAGINVSIRDSRIYLSLSNLKEFSADQSRGLATYNGKSYTPNNRPIILFPDTVPSGTTLVSDEDLKVFNDMLQYSASRSGYQGFGSISSMDLARAKFQNLPDEIRYHTISIDELIQQGFFSQLKFDDSLIGPMLLRPDYIARESMSSLVDGYMYTLNSMSANDLFVDFLFNPTNGMTLSPDGFFKGLTDDEIVNVFKKDDTLVAVYLVQDNSIQGYHVRRLPIEDKTQLDIARRLNASVVPYQVFTTSFEAINNTDRAFFKLPKGVSRATAAAWNDQELGYHLKRQPLYWMREVMFLYKVGYLTDPGTLMRNILDSNLKAMLDTRDPIGILRNNVKAHQQLKAYDQTLQLMRNTNPDLHLNTTGFKRFFRQLNRLNITPPMKEDDFLFIRSFIVNGPSANESKILMSWLADKKHKYSPNIPKDGSLDTMVSSIGSACLTPMSAVEARVRLAQFITLVNQGVTRTEAFVRVSEAAFNYSIKSNVDKMIEYIIPFYTFQKLNLHYWLEAIGSSPALARTLDDMTGVSWDTFDISSDEYQTNRSMQYHMMNGNIQLSDTGLVLKLNPSYLDAFNLLMDPQQKILNSTFAPLQNFIEYAFEDRDLEAQRQQLLAGTYPIQFGKYKGETIDTLMKPENKPYSQWLLTQQWFHDYYKPMYDYLMYNEVYKEPLMPIGKYKGQPLSSVPTDYKAYMLSLPDFVERYPYIVDIWASGRNTVLPEEDLDNEPILDFAEAEGLIGAGLFKQSKNAVDHLQSIAEKTLKDVSTYPVLGILSQRYLGTPDGTLSTGQTSQARLKQAGSPVQAAIARVLPGTFGAVKRYEEFKTDERYYETTPRYREYSLYTPRPNNYTYMPRRNRNNYYVARNRYRDARYYHQAQQTKFNLQKLKHNINSLRF